METQKAQSQWFKHCYVDSAVAKIALLCEKIFTRSEKSYSNIAFSDEWERTYAGNEFHR